MVEGVLVYMLLLMMGFGLSFSLSRSLFSWVWCGLDFGEVVGVVRVGWLVGEYYYDYDYDYDYLLTKSSVYAFC